METNDTNFREMQEQMKVLREKLENEKVINQRIMRRTCSMTANRLKFKANVPILFGVAAILMSPSYLQLGASLYTVIFTCVLMLVCIAATIICNRYIPSMEEDLVSAAEKLTKFKKFHAEWIKYALPTVVLWVGIVVWDILHGSELSKPETIGFICGVVVGVTLGALLGFKMRRDQLEAADDLLEQIEELKRG